MKMSCSLLALLGMAGREERWPGIKGVDGDGGPGHPLPNPGSFPVVAVGGLARNQSVLGSCFLVLYLWASDFICQQLGPLCESMVSVPTPKSL